MKTVDELVQSVTLYKPRYILFHGYIGPFLILYISWFYLWAFVYGMSDYFEAGMISLAILGIIQILTCLFCHWSVHIRCMLSCKSEPNAFLASVAKVVPTPNNGSPELVHLQHTKSATDEDDVWFIFQKTKYIYDSNKKCFQGLHFPDNLPIPFYQDWKGYADDSEARIAENRYGLNELEIVVPEFKELFKERATAPFFVFQVFCVGLWCLDEFWYYSLFTLAMLVAFECTLVQQQLRNLSEIRKMGSKPYNVQCYRNRKWRPISSSELIPGDVVSIGRSQNDCMVPCDLLLMRGTCIVDESMLTGESVPQMKEPVEGLDSSENFDFDTHGRLHVLYGGTKILQHTCPNKTSPGLRAPDNGCVAYVLRTSFNTSQGKLLRTILFGVKRVTANNLETFCFILFLLIFAIAAASYVWIKGSENPDRNRYKLFLECTLILTSVVPPELPIELSLAVNTSLLALSKLYVYCTEPFRIPFAGKVVMCCFDKTGTLTSDSLVVEGIAGLEGKEDKICDVKEAPLETIQVLVTCHSLVQLDDGIVGDPLEKATLSAAEWILTKGDSVVPRKSKVTGLKIFQRFHFSSALKRMSVIAGYCSEGTSTSMYIASVKGAPEVLKPRFVQVPDNYDSVYLEMSRRGARVLALGRRHMGALTPQQVREMQRDDVEKDLDFVGFVLISCPLKPDSKDVIQEIQSASHHVMMVTGDAPLTACHVARELNFTKHKKTVILTPVSSGSHWEWRSVDETVSLPAIPDKGPKEIYDFYDICLTGEGMNYIGNVNMDFLKAVLPHVCVFARVDPKQKESVITGLKSLGLVTLMCGDGTNDVGALKHADVGVAIISGGPQAPPIRPKKLVKDEDLTEKEKLAVGRMEGVTGEAHRKSSNKSKISPDRKVKASLDGKMKTSADGKLKNHPVDNKSKVPGKSAPLTEHQVQKRLQKLIKEMEEQETLQIVKLGDASIAAPFTSKLSSIECICHIIKQGRCTLVTTLQMFKILALNALILAYSQSVLYLDGIKFSDYQATLQGFLLAGCFLFISRSKPLKTLSAERPLPNIFNAYTILTVLFQFMIHFCCLINLVTEAKSRSPPQLEKFPDLEAEFAPSLLNSTVYITSMALQLSTFIINYRGHPFMESISENKPLMYCSFISGISIIVLVIGMLPDFSDFMQIVEFPFEFQKIILTSFLLDFLLTFVIDRTCLSLFGKGKLPRL